MSVPWKLSPSDLTFLWSECPRCFYLKVVHGFTRPGAAFPKVFTRIDGLMKGFFDNKPASELSPALPDGVVRFGGRQVTSEPVQLPGHPRPCFLKGRIDVAIQFADGSFGVVDFKTSQPHPGHVPFYSRQLHAYAYALEHPQAGSLGLSPVSRLGLLAVEPMLMERGAAGRLAYLGDAVWLECPKDYGLFLTFLDRVLSVLELAEPPPAAPTCSWCQYRDAARSSGY